MKVTVRDLEVFKSLDVNVTIAYLQKNGWHEHSRIYDNKGAIWVKKMMQEMCLISGYL